MKNTLLISLLAVLFLTSCNKDEKILNTLNDYNISMESQGYHFGDKLNIPQEVLDDADKISISFGDKETDNLTIDPKYFTLGDNAVTFNITKKDGKVLNQDATINVFAKKPEANLTYKIVAEYPHDTSNFTEGFFIEGNNVYESVGMNGNSRLLKYQLGSTTPILEQKQPDDIFAEGIVSFGDKIYQLTYKAKKGFIYDKNTFKLLSEFQYPPVVGEGWGMTTDGKNLIITADGSKNIYFLNPENPSQVVKTISVAGNSEVYDQLNELEYHNGFLYSNVWQKPIILKINPENGEVVGKFDFTEIAKENTKDPNDDVLNGIAFKGENMVITGKYWPKIYEVSIR